jgi:predicted permease
VVVAQSILERALKLPTVKSAGITDHLPLEGADGMWFVIENQLRSLGQRAKLKTVAVTPDLFHTLRIPLLEGRLFTERDTANSPPVVVINQTLARSFFPGQNPLGRRLQMEDSPSVWREIVGVVVNVCQRNLDEDSAPIAYRPWDQAPSTDYSLAVRVASSADIPGTTARLRASLRTLDKNQVWEPVETMQQLINDSESVSLRRPIVRMLGTFGILAALLAAVGIYGVVSYSVRQRSREIGVRLALGADRRGILALVFRETMLLTTAGLALGVASALLLTRVLPTGPIGWTGAAINLYGVSRTDLLTYAGFAVLLALIAGLASYVPARRATKVDPMVALRYE